MVGKSVSSNGSQEEEKRRARSKVCLSNTRPSDLLSPVRLHLLTSTTSQQHHQAKDSSRD